jgi:hypothetical protein
MNDEFEIIWTEAVVSENWSKPQKYLKSEYLMSQHEPNTSQIQVQNATVIPIRSADGENSMQPAQMK